MKLTEKQIESLIYENPWILDERYVIPNIHGSEGQNGRQVNIGIRGSRYIDLLFKDTRDERPVIIELKRGKLSRENVAQILEYRGLLTTLNDDSKDKWRAEFGINYFAPKMVLIGSESDEEVTISANLAGVEIRTLDDKHDDKIGFDTFKEIKAQLKAWKDFRNSGNRTLEERADWISGKIDIINDLMTEKKYKDIVTISSVPSISRLKSYLAPQYPFIDIPFFYKDYYLMGLYEFQDSNYPFNEKYIYCDFNIIEDKFEKKIVKQIGLELNKIGKRKKLLFKVYPDYELPTFLIPRKVLENHSEMKSLIGYLIDNAIRLHDEYIL